MQYSDGASNARPGMKNRDFRPISRFISDTIQDATIVTMECEWETLPKLSNITSFNDLTLNVKGSGYNTQSLLGLYLRPLR